MSVEMKQKAGANVTPKDDALLYDFLIADSGVVEGCVVSAIGGTQMKITSGRGVILGRVFVIEAETIQATLPATTETQNGRLLVRINGTTQEIAMVTQAAASLPALQKEDINRGGTLYELELATYKITNIYADFTYPRSIGKQCVTKVNYATGEPVEEVHLVATLEQLTFVERQLAALGL